MPPAVRRLVHIIDSVLEWRANAGSSDIDGIVVGGIVSAGISPRTERRGAE
jgi:hypothetical protein